MRERKRIADGLQNRCSEFDSHRAFHNGGTMKKRSLKNWVRDHRDDLDKYIELALGGPERHRYRNDDERRGWVLNDESLYLWARSEGVEI